LTNSVAALRIVQRGDPRLRDLIGAYAGVEHVQVNDGGQAIIGNVKKSDA
jgi:hypothetical protein